MTPYYSDDLVTIYHADARDVLAMVHADVLITDPPYGLSGSSGTINRERAKAIYLGDRADDLTAVRTVYVPVVRWALVITGGRGAVTPGTPHAFEYPKPDDIAAILQPATHGMSTWGRPTWQPVLLYGRDPRVGLTIQPLTFTSNGQHDVSGHPCPKGDDVSRWLVSRASLDGETILDPFAGSGSFLIAAKELGRHAIGIEIEERYCEIAATRCSQEVLGLTA